VTAPAARALPAAGARSGATIDLHLHSTASDGLLPPAAVVAAAHTAGIAAIALTDHDTVAGIPEARRAADHSGMRLIAGVELSAEEAGREFHILGLHLTNLAALQTRLAELREARLRRARAIVARLAELGITVSYDAVLTHAAGGAVGRPHVARAMIDAGAVQDHREAFDGFLGAGRAAYVPKEKLSVEAAVAIIHAAGGLAFWAHPGSSADEPTSRAFAAAGMDGLEVLHPSHVPDVAARLGALCESASLLPTGGSDWHATAGSTRALGSQAVPWEWLERHDAALAGRGASVMRSG